ncbi:AAA family ATPase [Paenibacillus flagellatus]|uniref:AAA family ATPase n=1 Tax=Paenibacillus flagellatus TaxID=2211139 RepID=UPI001305233B|nr:ATP-binding protein [Paenibacillus flagellatus]
MRKRDIREKREETGAGRAYSHVWEHYADELRLLDLKLQRLYVRRGQTASDPQADAFRGMYVSEDEFMRMVGGRDGGAEDDPELAALAADIRNAEAVIASRKAESAKRNVFLPLVYLSAVFGLDEIEQSVVMLLLAVELDRKYERVFGFMADDLTVRLPNVGLALQVVCRDADAMRTARLAFAPNGKLARYLLAREDGGEPFGRSLLSKPLALDRRMATFLLDTGAPDETLRPAVTIHYPDEPLAPLVVHLDAQRQLASVASTRNGPVGVLLWGPPGSGKTLQLRHCCAGWGKSLLVADMRVFAEDGAGFAEKLSRIVREAVLHQAALALAHADALFPEEADAKSRERLRIVEEETDRFPLPLFVLTESRAKPDFRSGGRIWLERELAVPGEKERESLWRTFASAAGLPDGEDWSGPAVKYRFTPGQIRDAVADAVALAEWEGKPAAAVVDQACYRQIRHRLERKAVRIEPRYGWDDIVLPDEQKELLRNACAQMKYRSLVYGEWGFERKLAYGKGLSMLYAGPPGTGKTMSAQVIARELRMELYKIDLSQVISKYIGETEKNLHELFLEAHKSSAILFFDETDALFGKRSEVKDAHDKYANIETAYLLQKMEEYEGISILATNLLNNIDEAFLRRIQYVIKFPFPDAEYREKIWRATFPRETPLAEDVDFRWLAGKYEIAGGNIKNVVLSAAFLAAEKGVAVGMREIVQAVRHELQKSGKIISRTDWEDY